MTLSKILARLTRAARVAEVQQPDRVHRSVLRDSRQESGWPADRMLAPMLLTNLTNAKRAVSILVPPGDYTVTVRPETALILLPYG